MSGTYSSDQEAVTAYIESHPGVRTDGVAQGLVIRPLLSMLADGTVRMLADGGLELAEKTE